MYSLNSISKNHLGHTTVHICCHNRLQFPPTLPPLQNYMFCAPKDTHEMYYLGTNINFALFSLSNSIKTEKKEMINV